MKRCPQCGKEKPLSDFYHDKRRRDSYSSVCKTCTYARVRAWQRANPDKVREQGRRHRLRHYKPSRKKRGPPTAAELRVRSARRLKRQREYCRAHRAELREWKRAWRRKHRRRIRAYYRKYYRENRDHLLALKAKYRANRRAARNKLKRT